MIVFMKRDLFILMGLGLLMCATFGSCEDKEIDKEDGSGAGKEGSGEIYRNVQDSILYYTDGKLSSKRNTYYDSDGKVIRELTLGYDTNGNLVTNQEGTYTYNKYSYDTENDYTIVYDNHGLMYDTKTEFCYKGSGNNSTSTRKIYALIDNEWIFSSEYFNERNDIMSKNRSISYGYIDGQRIIISSSSNEYSKDPLESTSTSINISYTGKYTVDRNAPGYTTSSNVYIPIQSLNGGSWRRITYIYDADGRQLESLAQESNDSIEWQDVKRVEDKYDSKGKILEEKQTGDGIIYKYSFTYDSMDNLLKEECFRKTGNDEDYVLCKNVNYSFSAAGKRMAIEFISISNDIALPRLLGKDTSSGITFLTSGNAITPLALGMSGNNPDSTKCSITCDINGYPSSEILYRQDTDGNWVECGRCTIKYDSDGKCLSYVVRMLENGTWIETASMQSTYDSKGNTLEQYVRTISTSFYPEGMNPRSISIETESTTKNEYNSLGYISYKIISFIRKQHFVYSNGENEVRPSETKQEVFYSTIKVK